MTDELLKEYFSKNHTLESVILTFEDPIIVLITLKSLLNHPLIQQISLYVENKILDVPQNILNETQ